ncbi:MAG: porin family protein [Chitinophagaceae bacterium]
MKKHTTTICISMIISLIINAQQTRFGISAGAAISNYHAKLEGETDNGNSIAGITAGVLADIPFGKHFSFQPALNWVQKGTKEEVTIMGITGKTKLTGNHLEIPLNFLYNVSGNTGTFFIGAGPSLAFGLSGKWKYDDGTNSLTEDVQFGDDPDNDDMKGVDFGANLLTGYRFPNGLFISANYNLGLSNLVPGGSEEGTLKSSYFGIRLGWLLNGKTVK